MKKQEWAGPMGFTVLFKPLIMYSIPGSKLLLGICCNANWHFIDCCCCRDLQVINSTRRLLLRSTILISPLTFIRLWNPIFPLLCRGRKPTAGTAAHGSRAPSAKHHQGALCSFAASFIFNYCRKVKLQLLDGCFIHSSMCRWERRQQPPEPEGVKTWRKRGGESEPEGQGSCPSSLWCNDGDNISFNLRQNKIFNPFHLSRRVACSLWDGPFINRNVHSQDIPYYARWEYKRVLSQEYCSHPEMMAQKLFIQDQCCRRVMFLALNVYKTLHIKKRAPNSVWLCDKMIRW